MHGSIQWGVTFIMKANDWEVNRFSSFFDSLYLHMVGQNDEDKMIWGQSRRSMFEMPFYNSYISTFQEFLALVLLLVR